jgi:hypothetical protein
VILKHNRRPIPSQKPRGTTQHKRVEALYVDFEDRDIPKIDLCDQVIESPAWNLYCLSAQ